jgi:glutamate/tyrosine decarboxylase-like PLP-dependent enzyme
MPFPDRPEPASPRLASPDPAATALPGLLAGAAERAGRYLAGLDKRPVAPGAAALAGLSRFDEPLPERPGDPAATLALLDDVGSPATMASAGGRYFGFVVGGTHPAALAANWLATAWDQNAALPVMSPVAARLHDVVTGWLAELLGLPAGSAAAFVTGATMANATALTAARDRQLAEAGWDVQADGLFGAPALTVVVGEQAHSTVFKALGMIGLGRQRVRRVPADDQGRLRAGALPRDVTGPAVICVQAGEVNTGAFDPFPAVIEWARERGAWVHADGAFGLWALADPSRAHLTAGLADADSWAADGHKWLNVPYDCGLALVRRPEDLRRSFAAVAGYLPSGAGFEAMHHTPQSSQRARQVDVWAVLRTLGRQGVADLVARSCDHASVMAGRLRAAGLDILNDVVLNQVLVRAATDEQTLAMVQAVQADGTCWCGPTTWQGRPAMRISVSGWATTAGDISASADAVIAAARNHGVCQL